MSCEHSRQILRCRTLPPCHWLPAVISSPFDPSESCLDVACYAHRLPFRGNVAFSPEACCGMLCRQTRGFAHGLWGVMTLGLGLLCRSVNI